MLNCKLNYINITTVPIGSAKNTYILKMHSTQIEKKARACKQPKQRNSLLSWMSCESESVNFQINKYWDPIIEGQIKRKKYHYTIGNKHISTLYTIIYCTGNVLYQDLKEIMVSDLFYLHSCR